MADGNAVAMATLALTQGYSQFNAFLPPLRDVRRAEPGDDISADVRVGEIAAFVGTLGVGIIVSSLSGSSIPTYVSIVTAVFLISIYESVLKSSPVVRNA